MTGENDVKGDRQPGGRAPAAGELGTLQSFLNTKWDLDDPRKDEILTSPGALEDWLRSRDLLQHRRRLAESDLDRALAVREGLRALAFVNNDHPLDEAAVDSMRRASRGAASEIRIEPEGPLFVAPGTADIDAAIGALFAITARAMIDGSWKRLKACPGRYCGWVFYDASRNQSARWCSMKVCGDREKSRAYYRRRTGHERIRRAG
jgi:predicted RNA-binding Zn ribbon-like protein